MTWDTINHLLLRKVPDFSPTYPQDGGSAVGGLEVFNKSLKKYNEEQVFWEGRKVACLRASQFCLGIILSGAIAAAITQTLAPWIGTAIIIGVLGFSFFYLFSDRAIHTLSLHSHILSPWTKHVTDYLSKEIINVNSSGKTKSDLSLEIWKKVTGEFFKSRLEKLKNSTNEETMIECMKDLFFYNTQKIPNSWNEYLKDLDKSEWEKVTNKNKELFKKIKEATLINPKKITPTDCIQTFEAINKLIPEDWVTLS